VTDVCPECAIPVWSTQANASAYVGQQIKPEAFVLGLLSLLLFVTCLGPLALGLAIPAVVKGRRATAMVATGRYPKELASQAKTGMILGWITIGLSGALILFYVGMIAMGAIR